ncbi:hypothetical protein KA977_04635 [Candidatus Dependentiae bacterium]|nr:hypothetical protein [Candidatus Dependentiae bacterium]
MLLKPDDTESKKVLEQIKYQKQIVYNKNIFIDNILSSRNDNKQINFINPSLGQKLDLYFSVNILRDYEPLLNKYPYKEITFKTGAGYNSFYKKNPVSIYLKKGILKQINDNTGENEYSLSINSLTLKSSYSFNKTHLTTVLNLNQNNNQGPSYFKTSNDCIRLRPFLLLNNEISENYKIYTSYSSEDWYRKSSNSNNLFIESLHTFSISNLFISKKTYYSLDMSRSVYSKDSVRNYTDYIFQADKLLTSSLKKELRLILKYKYRDYKNSNLHFYYFKTFYSFNQLNNSKIKYGCSYEFNLIKPYTTTGHKLETNLTYKLNEKINVSIETDFLFYTAKDKDRELNTFLKLDYKY